MIERFKPWLSLTELAKIGKKYTSTDTETSLGLGEASFVEKTQIYTKDEF